MNEATQANSTETSGNWDIDTSDLVVEDEDSSEAAEDTTSETADADQADTAEGEADTSDTKSKETKETDQFTVKYLGEEKTVSREEAPALIQKGMDHDRQVQKLNELTKEHETLKTEKSQSDELLAEFKEIAAESGLKDINELLDNYKANKLVEQGIDPSVALERVRIDRERKELAAEKAKIEAEKTSQASVEMQKKALSEKAQRDYSEFTKKYPNIDVSTLPEAVMKEAADGMGLVAAYAMYENAQLKAERDAEKKAAENQSRSTGSRASAGNSTKKDTEDNLWYSEENKHKSFSYIK